MYILIIWIPLMSAMVGLMMGRWVGVPGVKRATVGLLGLTWLTGIIIYKEVVYEKTETYIKLWTWVMGEIGLQYDSLTAIMIVVVTSISWLVHIYSTEYMSEDPHLPRFMGYLSLFTWFMLILVTADNLIQLFVGWEGVGLCSYLLINYWYTRQQANKAAMQAMIVNRIGDVGVVLAIVICYAQYKTVEYSVLFTVAEESEVSLIGYMLLVGAVGKSAQIGLHTWLPSAMEGLGKVLMGPQKTLLYAGTLNQKLWSTPVGYGLGKIQRSGQSAGNFQEEAQEEVQEGSSETIRKAYNKEFIDWLVGFAVISERNLEFKITQSSTDAADAAVLYYIKKELGWGVK